MMNKKRKITAFGEILILVVATLSFAYLIHENTSFFYGEDETDYKINFSFLKILKVFNIFYLIPSVSAQSTDLNYACCPRMNNGALCQNILPPLAGDFCAVSVSPTSCELDSRCRLGCSIDPVEGLCSTNTPRLDLGDNDWIENDPQCLNQRCVKGCCNLGSHSEFVTQDRCYYLAGLSGLSVGGDFEDPFDSNLLTENQCLGSFYDEEKGACIVGENNHCTFTSGIECANVNGDFKPGALCTDPSLGTSCEMTSETTCLEGRDEVYFVDSCGNIANIFERGRDNDISYWTGIVLKVDSCGNDDVHGNANSASCGNCNTFLGTRCGETQGTSSELRCLDLNCASSDKTGNKPRVNGESWCVYDSAIGEGRDTPGSRHWKRICIDGEVKVEPCQDYRGQICVESRIEERGNYFSTASCKINEAIQCLNYNDVGEGGDQASKLEAIENMKKQCNENEDCYINHVDVDPEGFVFDMCVPNYPRGIELNSEDPTFSEELCGFASQTCIMVQQKKITGGWKCVHNCDCKKPKFAEEMNDLCISVGDCGASVNYVGVMSSENYIVRKSPRLGQGYLSRISDYANAVSGVYAKPKNISDIAGAFSITGEGEITGEESQYIGIVRTVGLVSGGIGLAVRGIGWLAGSGAANSGGALLWTQVGPQTITGYTQGGLTTGYAPFTVEQLTPATATSAGGFMSALSGVGTGATVGYMVAKAFGLQGDAALAVTAGAAVAGGVAGFAAAGYAAGSGSTIGSIASFAGALGPFMAALVWAVIAAVVIALIMSFLGIGKTREVSIEFQCLPWKAPIGSNKCDECNKDPELFPCTKYRCDSLGQACEFINEDTEFAACEESNPNDHTPPLISANEVVTDGFRFQNEVEYESVEVRNSNGGCIPEFTNVVFSLKTDERAQCKFGYDRTNRFEDLTEFPILERTSFTHNHTFSFLMPNIDSLDPQDIIGDLSDRLGAKEIFVRCQDNHGNANTYSYEVDFCVQEGPDLTPPRIRSYSPPNGGFIPFGTTETILSIFVNEPAECRYSVYTGTDVSYDTMTEMSCSTSLQSLTINGWPCRTILTGLTNTENRFLIKCKDQPWLDDPDYSGRPGTRNTNNGDEYIISGTENVLSIDSITPNEDIVTGYTPFIRVDLGVTTSGGSNNGVSTCSYSLSDYESNMIEILHTRSTSHSQPGLGFTAGTRTIYIECMDDIGNVARDSSTFNIIIDEEPPQIVRVFNEGGLKIITNEQAKCYYRNDICNFILSNGTSMTSAFDIFHEAPWNEGLTYYIKCEDLYGNKNSECALSVIPTNINQ